MRAQIFPLQRLPISLVFSISFTVAFEILILCNTSKKAMVSFPVISKFVVITKAFSTIYSLLYLYLLSDAELTIYLQYKRRKKNLPQDI